MRVRTGSFLLAGLVACADGSERARPNIVVILADDLGWKDVSYSGSEYSTPNIDRLAAEGVVFTQACAAASSCSPTRAALMTGRSPARVGITSAITIGDYEREGRPRAAPRDWTCLPYPTGTRLPDGVPTFADRLRDAGYETAFIGKWHLGRPGEGPAQHGFEHESFVGSVGGGGYFPPYKLTEVRPTRAGTYLTDRLTDEALAFLRRPHARPFCLVLAHFAVHAPIRGKPELVREFQQKLAETRARGSPQANAEYAAMLWSLDESVGRITAALSELGLDDETLLVFTSDNGPVLQREDPLTTTAPLRGEKLELYEGGLRVPLVIRWPGVAPAGETRSAPVVTMDLHATLLGAARLEPSVDELHDGRDLVPLLAGDVSTLHERLGFFQPHREACAALRRDDWKLIHWFGRGGRNELYDLAHDPGEARDLALDEPARARALQDELFAWIQSAGAELPVPNPDYDPDFVRVRAEHTEDGGDDTDVEDTDAEDTED